MERIVLFDAVATLIRPRPSVAAIYHEVGQRFGSELSQTQIEQRFAKLRNAIFPGAADEIPEDWDALHLPSSEAIERQLWRTLVQELFDDVDDRQTLFDEIWNRFSQTDAWALYDDVPPCLTALRQRGWRLGIASNFDSRLVALVRGIPVLNQFEHVFISSYIGTRKPDLRFYRSIQRWFGRPCIMVGNHRVHDCLGPVRVGWQAYWLNRREAKTENVVSDSLPTSAPERTSIRTLAELPALLARFER